MKRLALLILLAAGASAALHAQTFYQYGEQCAKEVTPIPAFSCMAGETIPITVDGKIPAKYTANMTCDKPSLLVIDPPEAGSQGQCLPGSRALVLRDYAQAQISAICRKHVVRDITSSVFDEINIVSHNLKSGKTCWFTAKAKLPYTAGAGIDGRLIPSPSSLPAKAARRGYEKLHPESEALVQEWKVAKTTLPNPVALWMSPSQLVSREPACTKCHDSGPFMYSPYIAQTTQLPSDAFGKYQPRAIGQAFKVWPQPFALTTRGNTCTTCHRIGNMNSCSLATLQATGQVKPLGGNEWSAQFPQSHWMSPGNLHSLVQWQEAFKKSAKEISDCCANPSGAACQKISYDSPVGSSGKR